MGIGFQGMAQLLKVLYALRLGFDAGFVGSLFAVGATCFGLTSVPAGALGGRVGPRRVMIAGALISTAGMLMLAISDLLPQSVRAVGLLSFEVLGPMGWSMLVVNQISALTTATTALNRRRAYGLKEAMLGFGMLLGALVGGFLPEAFAGLLGVTTAEPAPYRYAVLTATVVSLTALLPLFLLRPIPPVAHQRIATSSLPPLMPLLVIGLCAFLNNAALASARAFSAAYMDTVFGLPSSLIGTITSIGTFVAILAALSSARVGGGRGSVFTMLVATLVMAACLLIMAAFPHWGMVSIGLIGAIGVASMWMPAYQVVQMEMVAAEWRPLVAGVASLAMSMGFGSMSLVGGRIVVAWGYRQLYGVATLLALASASLALALARQRAHQTEVAAAAGELGIPPAEST